MSPLLPGLAVALCVFGVAIGYALSRSVPSGVRGLIEQEDEGRRSSLLLRLQAALSQRFGRLFLAGMSPRRTAQIHRRIDLAGRPEGLTLEVYGGRKAAATILGAMFGTVFALLLSSPYLAVAGTLLGWLMVDVSLIAQGSARQARIARDLPDFLDVLAVTVGAGLGFRNALGRVGEALGGPIGDEVRVALAQMNYGATRRAALEGIRDRNESPELAQFITALLQAEELGAPLGEALGSIARDMRKAFHQNARRDAARAVPRVTLVVSLLGVPAVLVLVLAALYFSTDLDLSVLGG